MTLEDAILYHDRNPRLYENAGWSQSSTDARQHVEWLTELRKLRNTHIRQLAEIHGLKDENARLRELVDAWMGCGTRYHTMSGACPMFDKDAKDFCKADKLAQELGIEVGE